MRSDTARATTRSQPHRSTRQRSRVERTDAVAEAEASSTRAAASRRAVFRSTLRGWQAQRVHVPDWPALSAFAESPEGFRALHRIVLAALFVFGVMHGAGAGTLRQFLQLAGLAPWFACSESTLRRAQARMVTVIGAWGDAQRKELGAAMFTRVLTVLLDETWKPSMILVALDAASGFLLCEKHAKARDGLTWKATMSSALTGLKVTIHHAVADRARGIARYVRGLVGAHASADLFHGLHDLGSAVLALHRKRDAALRAARKSAGAARCEARALARRLEARIEVVTARLREVSDTFHPFELATGRAVSVEALRARLEPISILGVARMLKRGREVIERSEPLRAIVSKAQVDERQQMEARIREAATAIEAQRRTVTVAAVCRELGLHRSYVEKRGRLREIVQRARRS